MITSIVEQSFFLYQVCHNDFQIPRNICLEIERHPGIKDLIHRDVSNFQNYNILINEVITLFAPILFVFYFRGIDKKYFILLGLFGKLVYSVMIVINAYYELSVIMILFTASLPCAFSGSDILIISNSFAYLSERTLESKKSFRITLLNSLILATMPLGTLIGKILFKQTTFFHNSYEKMFILNVCILLISIILTLYLERDRRCNKNQEEEEIELSSIEIQNEKNLIYNSYRSHSIYKRILRLILDYKVSLIILISGLHILQRSEKFYLYLFTQYKLSWTFEKFSNFKFVQTLLFMVVSITTAIILNKVNINNLILIIFGAIGNITSRILYILANNDIIFYIGGCFTSSGPLISSSVKCYLSHIIHKKDLRVIFVITTIIENVMTMAASFLYNILYVNTNEIGKEWLFSLTILTQGTILILICLIRFL